MQRAAILLVLLAACDAPPVQWSDPVALGGTVEQRLVVDTNGQTRTVSDDARTVSMPASTPVSAHVCATSLRTAWGTGGLHAAWWAVHGDSAAALYAASSPDSGRTWSAAVAVDTLDVSTRGCSRPPPALAVVGDDLQLAYSMKAPEGTGVFFAHFMGSMLHAPVAVIYGERLVATAIAADSDRVAVAYEEPNGSRAQVDVAMSSTQGHIFEWRETASRDVDLATAPAIALAGHEVAVAWSTRRVADSTSSRIVRVGRFR